MERSFPDSMKVKRVIESGQFSFDDDPRNHLEFQCDRAASFFDPVVIRVHQYYPEHRGYLYAEVIMQRFELEFMLNSFAVAENAESSFAPIPGGEFEIRRDEFGGYTFRLQTDKFPGDVHMIDQSLFEI